MSLTEMMNDVLRALFGCFGKKPDTKLAMAVLELTYAKLMELTTYEEDIAAIKGVEEAAREPMRKKHLELYQCSLELADNVMVLAGVIEDMDAEAAVGTYVVGARHAKYILENKKARLGAEDLSQVDTSDFEAMYEKLECECRKINDINSPTVGLGERIDAALALADKVIELGKALEISDAGCAQIYGIMVKDAEDDKVIVRMKRRLAK